MPSHDIKSLSQLIRGFLAAGYFEKAPWGFSLLSRSERRQSLPGNKKSRRRLGGNEWATAPGGQTTYRGLYCLLFRGQASYRVFEYAAKGTFFTAKL